MPARATSPAEGAGAAFAPGHVTGLFAPDLAARDPRGRGSVGAGLVLELGVHAEARWRSGGARSELRIRSDAGVELPISSEVARRLLGGRRGRLEVRLRHELPIGQGFGMSAAGAVASGLAVARSLGEPRQRALETAHLSDLFGGGGLGGVAAILGGGLEIRDRAGIPPFGRVRHRPVTTPILLAVVGGPLPSPPLLRDPAFLDRVRDAAAPGLARLRQRPGLETFLDESERFTDRLGLAPLGVRRRIADLRATGSPAAQAMFGECVFMVPRTDRQRRAALRVLDRARLHAVELRTSRRGAASRSIRG
jgi:pantoate kinase